MFIQIKNLLNQPVLALETKSKIGTTSNIVVNPENGLLVAFIVKAGFLGTQKLLSYKDIREIRADCLIVDNEDRLVELKELPRVANLIKKKISILNCNVKTQKGEWIGKIEDLLVDSISYKILKYYVQGFVFDFHFPFFCFKEDRIIPCDKIIAIKPKVVIIKEKSAKGEQKKAAEEKIKATAAEPA